MVLLKTAGQVQIVELEDCSLHLAVVLILLVVQGSLCVCFVGCQFDVFEYLLIELHMCFVSSCNIDI